MAYQDAATQPSQQPNQLLITNVVVVDINMLADLVEDARVPEHILGYIALLSDPTFPGSPSLERAVLEAVEAAAAAKHDFEDSMALVPSAALDAVAAAVEAELTRRTLDSLTVLPSASGF